MFIISSFLQVILRSVADKFATIQLREVAVHALRFKHLSFQSPVFANNSVKDR